MKETRLLSRLMLTGLKLNLRNTMSCTSNAISIALWTSHALGVLLVIKMYIVAVITGQVRLRKKAFANPEDAERHGGIQHFRDDPYVERCLRAHRNDMENIFPFLFLGAVYSLIGPSLAVARIHFLVFFLFRVLHTVAYLLALRAPTRSIAYVLAQVPCLSMAVQVIAAVFSCA
ncbi:hypothetical protein UPYG_G00277850 [Umbra pygmaea]|uniref:Prostaglandin E synthase n=1 Tax=Umbra pygmaea TaxID=75934 RepID=A0ABD0WNF0_UMBPY